MPEAVEFRALCVEIAAATDSPATVVSRLLGDVLIQLAEHVEDRDTLLLGQGYLASDFPLTMEVLQLREPRTVWTEDEDADPHERRLLEQFGYRALLMLPVVVDGETWGLCESYRKHAPYRAEDVATATRALASRLGS